MNQLGKETGSAIEFVDYPEFLFDEAVLKKFMTNEYLEYQSWCRERKSGMELYIPICLRCGQAYPVSVTKEASQIYDTYQMQGLGLIQDVFPDLHPGMRELLRDVNGVCTECWKELFSDPFADEIDE